MSGIDHIDESILLTSMNDHNSNQDKSEDKQEIALQNNKQEEGKNVKDDKRNDTLINNYSKFLEANEWNIEKLKQRPEWEQIDGLQKQELERVCQHGLMMKAAIQWVKEEDNRSINDILKQEKFVQLKKYKKFKRWLSNKKFYIKRQIETKQNESNIQPQITKGLMVFDSTYENN